MKCLVIIPTFNERENIEQIVQAILLVDSSLNVLVIDDNSPDRTFEIVHEMSQIDSRVKLIKRSGKLGLGSAYVTGFRYAIENLYDCIIQMDADFSHDPAEIPNLLAEIETNDLVIGSRYVVGINVINWPLSRLILSCFAAQYVQIITGMKIKDPTGGFKCIRIKTLKAIDLDNIMSDGYSFQVEINYRVWEKRRFKMKEIPIIFTDRRSGKSKMSKRIVREAIWMVWKLKLFSLLNKL
jgi:dolichol-phosphate mannosyltransferase